MYKFIEILDFFFVRFGTPSLSLILKNNFQPQQMDNLRKAQQEELKKMEEDLRTLKEDRLLQGMKYENEVSPLIYQFYIN